MSKAQQNADKNKLNTSSSLTHKSRNREILLLILNLIFAFAASFLIIRMFAVAFSFWEVLLFNLLLTALFSLLFFNWKSTLVVLSLLALLALLITFVPALNNTYHNFLSANDTSLASIKSLYTEFINTGFDFLSKNLTAQETAAYRSIGNIYMFINSLFSFIVIQKLANYWFPWLLTILYLALAISLNNFNYIFLVIIMIIVCLILTLLSSGYLSGLWQNKSGRKNFWQANSQLILVSVLAVVVSLIASSMIQYKDIYSSYLQGIVDDVMTVFPRSFQPTLTVNSYSIAQDGYYPLANRLGGTVNKEDREVFEITGSAPKLIKVQSSDFYTGLSWNRTVNNPNFRFNSPFNSETEQTVFNKYQDENFFNQLDPNAAEQIYNEYAYKLRPLVQGTQIIFASGTPTKLVSSRDEALLFYYNQAGTVYAKTSFNNQQFYSVETYDIDAFDLGFGSPKSTTNSKINVANQTKLEKLDHAAENLAAKKEYLPNHANAYQNYLQVPELDSYHEGGDMYNLAQNLTKNIPGQYSKVEAILNYLRYNPEFSYSLEVEDPPADQDFLTFFMQTKVGYCTYYATAMTMLTRLSGIPARYVEGYTLSAANLADLRQAKTITVNSENAHAWTEVYLDGLGWVAIDATPSEEDLAQDNPSETTTTEETTTATEKQTEETTTTAATTSENNVSSSELTSPTSSDATNNKDDENTEVITKTLLSIFFVLLLILLGFLYYQKRRKYINKLHNYSYISEKIPNSRERVFFYWQELLELQKLLDNFSTNLSMTENEIGNLLEQKYSELSKQQQKQAEKTLAKQSSASDKVQISNNSDNNITGNIVNNITEANTTEFDLKNNSINSAHPNYTNDAAHSFDSIEWNKITSIVAESKYSLHAIKAEDLKYLASSFDVLENIVFDQLGKAAYIRKRILPASQGKIKSISSVPHSQTNKQEQTNSQN